MDKYGINVNPHIPSDLELEAQLQQLLIDRYDELLLDAMACIGKKRNVEIPLGYAIGGRLSGCRVNYSARDRKFDFIQYSAWGKRGGGPYAKRIPVP